MKYILLLLTFLSVLNLEAQFKGTIIFEERVDLHRNLPPEKEELKTMIPEFNTAKWELIFIGDESIYQPLKEKELTGASANQSGYYMRFGREKRTLYKNMADDRIVDSRDFMQKQFLIKGFTSARKWKIGKRQKDIMGYKCMEASCEVDSTQVIAWFTPKINVSNGPSDYQGLPGMILQIDMNDGERLITATQIMLDSADASMLVIPTKGKEITSQEFEALRKEKMKEMNLQKSTSGPMIIRHH